MKKSKKKNKRKPYNDADYVEKVVRNWSKAVGLYERGEYSVAIIRCATCLELAVNFALIKELVDHHELPMNFVESLMKRSNGIRGKYQDLLKPLYEDDEKKDTFKSLWKDHIEPINKSRNQIVHKGEFRSKSVGRKVVTSTFEALNIIFNAYEVSPKMKLVPSI